MDNFKKFKQAFGRDWYIQGFNGKPLFLGATAYSGIRLVKQLGFGYRAFLFHYDSRGFSEMAYLNADFTAIWREIRRRLKRDKRYLQKVRQQYEKTMVGVIRLQQNIATLALRQLSEEKIMRLFFDSIRAQIDTAGVGHIIESVSVSVEKEFKTALTRVIGDSSHFNKSYALLTMPTRASFINRQEAALRRIAYLSKAARETKLLAHWKKYFWIQNSYYGPKKLTLYDFERWLAAVKAMKFANYAAVRREKAAMIRYLRLNKSLRELIELIDFVALWQDARKANILKQIYYLSLIAEEVSRRAKLPSRLLYELGIEEALHCHTIAEVRSLLPKLRQRQRGLLILQERGGEYIVSGSCYRRLSLLLRKVRQRSAVSGEALHGSVANSGTAVGRVVVCNNIVSLKKVNRGDVVVTSMTRPEFMVALKKASAIVTDEGGITCHAAIVARELDIPCIIGTRMATKVLKDGMTVEVKANHGLVKIIQ